MGIVTCSGFAGVYFEKVLKTANVGQQKPTVWELNFQLSCWSIMFGFLRLFMFDMEAFMEKGFFHGYR